MFDDERLYLRTCRAIAAEEIVRGGFTDAAKAATIRRINARFPYTNPTGRKDIVRDSVDGLFQEFSKTVAFPARLTRVESEKDIADEARSHARRGLGRRPVAGADGRPAAVADGGASGVPGERAVRRDAAGRACHPLYDDQPQRCAGVVHQLRGHRHRCQHARSPGVASCRSRSAFATVREYETTSANNEYYFGALLGRDTNWIKNGRFMLDGHPYQITLTDPPNTIHGGKRGFDKRIWTVEPLATSGATVSARLTYISPDGEEGFPGTVKATVTYSLSDDGVLTIHYQATTDKPTIVNLSSHLSFNLAGAGSLGGVLGQELTVKADRYLPLDQQQIPLGTSVPVAGTPFDFRRQTPIGARIHDKDPQLAMADGYDQYWVFNKQSDVVGPQPAARVVDPASGRTLDVSTTQPGADIYTGGFFSGDTVGIGGRYAKYAAFTMETQGYPGAINHPAFPSSVLRPGQRYDTTTIFRFGVAR